MFLNKKTGIFNLKTPVQKRLLFSTDEGRNEGNEKEIIIGNDGIYLCNDWCTAEYKFI